LTWSGGEHRLTETMARRPQLTSEQRRAAIVRAIRTVFAEKGFDGTTTRELAAAAGVSEALIFKHFPTKEDLYTAMLQSVIDDELDRGRLESVGRLEASTSTLVVLIHMFYSAMILGKTRPDGVQPEILARLMSRSATSDGSFARLFLREVATPWVNKVEQCLRAAIDSGDVPEAAVPAGVGAWLAHNLVVMIKMQFLTDPPTLDYGVPRERLVEHAVRFTLRGLGLSDQAIRRHYNPEAFEHIRG
jgi:AcrR family transcriptional regulator